MSPQAVDDDAVHLGKLLFGEFVDPVLYGYLLPNCNLFYLGKTHDDTWDRFPSWNRFKGGVMMEVDREGNVPWEHRDYDHHHDARHTESGGAIYLTAEKVPRYLPVQVKGGLPAEGEMWSDTLVEVDAGGNRIWVWHYHRTVEKVWVEECIGQAIE